MNNVVSVIVPVYNCEKYIGKCIESIINQTYQDIEIVLVDDGSTDGSGNICDRYSKKDHRIKIIHKENGGVSETRNIGMDASSGEYLLFVDADDWLEKDMCKQLIDAAINGNSDIVICGYKKFYEEDNTFKIIIPEKNQEKEQFGDLITSTKANVDGYLWTKLIRKSLIQKNFRADIAIKEDLVFLIENFKDCTKYSVVETPLYNYRIHKNSSLHSKMITDKKITSLDADICIINNIKMTVQDDYKLSFVVAYYNYCSQLDGEILKKIKEKYGRYKDLYYRDVMKSNSIGVKEKLKIFIKSKLYFLYRMIKRRKK